MDSKINLYFSDVFNVDKDIISKYGAFNISLINDLPLFIDPFLLFNSDKKEYQLCHNEIIRYLVFLKDKVSQHKIIDKSMLKKWFIFSEVKQNWLGFCVTGNYGKGLGMDFARALSGALGSTFIDFGEEKLTYGSHLEKVCLIKDGVGKDNISDFTTNLIKHYLLKYTQTFAKKHLSGDSCKTFCVDKVRFNYSTEKWESGNFDLPNFMNDYVLLTPIDILRRKDIWINSSDMIDDFENIPLTIPDEVLRSQINNYFYSKLSEKSGKQEKREAAKSTFLRFPILFEYYIKYKEDNGGKAISISETEVMGVSAIFHAQLSKFADILACYTPFYDKKPNAYEDIKQGVMYIKKAIEDNDGYKVFYINERPMKKEHDLQVMYRLICYGEKNSINGKVNNERSSINYSFLKDSKDSDLVKFKLASNPKLKKYLLSQIVKSKASDKAKKLINVIMFFSDDEHNNVIKILNELQLNDNENIILIDASGNKPSGSKV